jgi:hypothetical protein
MTEQYPKKLQFFDHEKKFVFCKQKKSYRHTKHSKKKIGFLFILNTQFPSKPHQALSSGIQKSQNLKHV